MIHCQFDLWLLCLNPAWTQFMYWWSLAWRILSITLLVCEMSAIERYSLALPFFGTGMKTDLFQSCGHCWVFQICWHIECSTSTASSFRIWNSSPGIPSPPLALFVVMLPKAHLTSHFKMSGSRWVITPFFFFFGIAMANHFSIIASRIPFKALCVIQKGNRLKV